MNFYEFASDAWVSWFWEHHFNGILLGRLPLIKKLKWREVLVCKGVWGTLSKENDGSLAGTQADLLFPVGHDLGIGPLCGDGIRRGEHL